VGRGFGDGGGPLALPGKYTVSASRRTGEGFTALGAPQGFEVVSVGNRTAPGQESREILSFYRLAGELGRAAIGAGDVAGEALVQIVRAQAAIRHSTGADLKLLAEAREIELKLRDAVEALTGDPARRKRHEDVPPSVLGRVQNAVAESSDASHGPTRTQRQDYEIALEEYQAAVDRLKELIEAKLPELYRKVEAAGVPWTPGRPLPRLRTAAF
jgi:hypothetical protein